MGTQDTEQPGGGAAIPAFAHLRYHDHDGVATITLARPDKLNALGIGPGSNRDELLQALTQADADPAVGAIMIAAEGRAFCGGGDLSGARPRETVMDDVLFHAAAEQFHDGLRAIRKPIIAAVQGHCLGAGLSLIAQCDLVIAAGDAGFGLVEGRLGLSGGTAVVHSVGAAWAKFLILAGEVIDAPRARDIGLVFAVVPAAELHARSFELARRIAAMPREATILNKAAVQAQVEAAGLAAGRTAGRASDPVITSTARFARAPDGRLFRDIIRSEGIAGLKHARKLQYTDAWLAPMRGPREP